MCLFWSFPLCALFLRASNSISRVRSFVSAFVSPSKESIRIKSCSPARFSREGNGSNSGDAGLFDLVIIYTVPRQLDSVGA